MRTESLMTESSNGTRRSFLKHLLIAGAITGVAGLDFLASCAVDEEAEVTPAEDLMREHGVLNRILLVYDHCKALLSAGQPFDRLVLSDSATIIRSFIEDYHEKLEEDYLFPRFEEANRLTALVKVLRNQHKVGRVITERLLDEARKGDGTDQGSNARLAALLDSFVTMYRPHEAREDTVLFPELARILSRHEYYALGEDFEKREHALFGTEGFEGIVVQVAAIEDRLGIGNLADFTPRI